MEVRATLDAIRSSADSVKKWRTDIVSVVVANSELGRAAFYLGAEGLLVRNSCYDSYKALKSAMGGAGDDQQWHHIVEQNQGSKSGFKATQINSDENITGLQTHVSACCELPSIHQSNLRPPLR